MLDKSFYTCVLCQTFSSCGKYLIAGNTYGEIAVFDIDKTLNPSFDGGNSHDKAKYIFTVEKDVPVTALASTPNHLIVGTNGEITGWDWKPVLHSKQSKPMWSIKIPTKKDFIENADVNSLWVSEDNEQLVAGCGDGNVYAFSLDGGRLLRSFEGHKDYIHQVHGLENQLVSVGEDGLLSIWDLRKNKAHINLEPYKNDKLSRPDVGKWLGAATLSDNWIVCGGGPRTALWHLRALEPAVVFDIPDRGVHVTSFHEEFVLVGGAAPHVYQVNYSGEVTVQLSVSATTVYSSVYKSSPHQILAIAGSSPKIDIATNFNYLDQVLNFTM